MPEGPLQDLKYAAQAVWQESQASLAEGKQRMQDYSKRSESCSQVINMLKALPDRTSHDIMLPLGEAAFIPARLSDPERCHVTLGEHAAAPRHAHTASSTCPLSAQGSFLC